MNLRMLLGSVLAVALCTMPARAQDVKARYHELFAAADDAGLAELWRANPGAILVTIDSDLEGSLSVWEAAPDAPDRKAIAELQRRALWGARVATEVTGRSIFRDYCASFVGWTDEQKKSFRAGQGAYGAARKALEESRFDDALEAAQRCRTLAAPLGDWWGTAMGYSAEGRALKGLGRHAEALAASGQARLLYQALGLKRNEFSDLSNMVDCAIAAERWSRARVSADEALRILGDGDPEVRRALLEKRMHAEGQLGLDDAAARTGAELEEL